MTWVKLDDGFAEHPKLIAAGGDAGWLHICAMCWSARNLTDGFLPAGIIGRLSDRRKPEALARTLVKVGLWEPADGGWMIHDWGDFQPSKERIEAERSAARDRMRRHRAGDVRANNGRSAGEVHFPRPQPDPNTYSFQTTTTARESAAPPSSSSSIDDPRFGETVDLAVEIAALAAGEVRSPGPWRAAVRRTIVAEHGPQIVAHLAARPGATAGETVRVVLGRSELDVARARQARSVG